MAAATVMSAVTADSDKVHPFFSRQQGFGQNTHEEPSENIPDEQQDKPKRSSSKRKKPKDGLKSKTQKTLGEIINPKASAPAPPAVVDLCSSEPDARENRRKRRRTGDHEAADVGSEEETSRTPPDEGRRSPVVLVSNSSPSRQRPATVLAVPEDPIAVETPPKKLLRLNAQGKFSSPPSKKSKDEEDAEPERPRRRTRQRKSTEATPEKKRLVVTLEYGGGDDEKRQDVGHRIYRILSGQETVTLPTKLAPKKSTSQKPKPSKPTHPFFVKGGNDAEQQQPPPKRESPYKSSAITPGKLKMQSAVRIHDSEETTHIFTSALLKDRHMIKHPGAKDAPFPAKDQVHVRVLEAPFLNDSEAHSDSRTSTRKRKRKQARLPFPDKQSVLSHFTFCLEAEDERELRPDGFYEPDPSLRIPRRLLISGQEIAERIAEEISVPLGESDADELSSSPPRKYAHPALQRLYAKIPTTLTAFDQSRGEAQAWSQKHAPSSSTEVLQPEKKTTILRDWMKSLAVQSVIGAAAQPSKPGSTKAAEKPKKKRKKKSGEMDDFLVSSDDEIHDMSEIIDDDDDTTTARKTTNSVVQAVNDGTKLSNAVLLSGPHGCGKTAAAYAIAKELGFKVFEISSSERRSGRDVLDRVGDMTANHLVKHHGTEDRGETSSNEEPSRIEEAFQKDLQSGRQGKMSSFFKPKAIAKKQTAPKKVSKEKVVEAIQESLKKPAKDQQQSIILLEEVDILFKDDKEFWTTVLKLISTSKRPFILTCNDEDLVPLNAMSFYAILRFGPPPLDLATDYMLLLAAAEGHLIKRQAVAKLYERHDHDLRASITELDYWCQMGIGDPREGLGWVYQRWPPGSDLDQLGRRLRVVSDGTYQQGMGLPARSMSTEDALLWMWSEFGMEPSTALGWQRDLPKDRPAAGDSVQARRQALARFGQLTETLSAADACCANGLPGTTPLDTTQKPTSKEARGNYIEGLEFLQTDERIDWTNMSKSMLTALTISAYRTFHHDSIEDNLIEETAFRKPQTMCDDTLSRRAFSCFDAISFPPELGAGTVSLQQSAFDSTLRTVALDLAPYVRSIVQYDQALEEQRERLDLLTSDGRRPKRARTTRAARSAQDGGQRATARRERWFTKNLDMAAVLDTGGETWPRLSGQLGTASVGSRDVTETGTAPTSRGESEEIQYEDA